MNGPNPSIQSDGFTPFNPSPMSNNQNMNYGFERKESMYV